MDPFDNELIELSKLTSKEILKANHKELEAYLEKLSKPGAKSLIGDHHSQLCEMVRMRLTNLDSQKSNKTATIISISALIVSVVALVVSCIQTFK